MSDENKVMLGSAYPNGKIAVILSLLIEDARGNDTPVSDLISKYQKDIKAAITESVEIEKFIIAGDTARLKESANTYWESNLRGSLGLLQAKTCDEILKRINSNFAV